MSLAHINTAQREEGTIRQQAAVKRVRQVGPNHQTLGSAVNVAHAVHAEPGGSTATHIPQPAAAAARCVTHQPCVAVAFHVLCS